MEESYNQVFEANPFINEILYQNVRKEKSHPILVLDKTPDLAYIIETFFPPSLHPTATFSKKVTIKQIQNQ